MQITDINGSIRNPKKVFLDPDFPGYVRVEFNRYHEWYSVKEFLEFNPDLKHIVEGAPERPADVAGIVSGSTKNTLTDSTQNWIPNSFMDYKIWISRGKGEGQVRHIIKNTKNTLTADKEWDSKPDHTSQYVIASELKEKIKAMGNTLPSEDMKALEEAAIKMDLERGIKPHARQYTKSDEDNTVS